MTWNWSKADLFLIEVLVLHAMYSTNQAQCNDQTKRYDMSETAFQMKFWIKLIPKSISMLWPEMFRNTRNNSFIKRWTTQISFYCSDVTLASWHLILPVTWLFVQQLLKAKKRKHQSSASLPRMRGQRCRKHFLGRTLPCHGGEVCWGKYIHYKVWDEITYPFLNFNGYTIEVWEWIDNFIPHLIGHAITHPCWD